MGLREGNDLRRRQGARLELLGDLRAVLDRPRDLLRMALSHLQPGKQRGELIPPQATGESGEGEPPLRHREPVAVVQLPHPADQPGGLGVRSKAWMDRLVETELS